MQVVILCGGLGTRMPEETEFRPKPMVEIGGKPILWHIMKLYSHFGMTDFVLCLGYKGNIIRDYFINYFTMNSDVRVRLGENRIEHLEVLHDERNWNVTLAETGDLTPTGGRIKRIARYIEGDSFMATYGDCLANVDLTRLLALHKSRGKVATVTGVRPASRFGELRTSGDLVTEFREKPQMDEGWVSGGFFVFQRTVFDYLSDDKMLEGEPLEHLAREGQLVLYPHDGFWRPMDTVREKRALDEEWTSGSAPWKLWKDSPGRV